MDTCKEDLEYAMNRLLEADAKVREWERKYKKLEEAYSNVCYRLDNSRVLEDFTEEWG